MTSSKPSNWRSVLGGPLFFIELTYRADRTAVADLRHFGGNGRRAVAPRAGCGHRYLSVLRLFSGTARAQVHGIPPVPEERPEILNIRSNSQLRIGADFAENRTSSKAVVLCSISVTAGLRGFFIMSRTRSLQSAEGTSTNDQVPSCSTG